MANIRDPFVQSAMSEVHWAGNPPAGKHWRVKGIGVGGVKAEAVRTLFACGSLRVQRGPKKDEFQYEIIHSESGLRLCGFGTKRIAFAFAQRLGPTFDRIFDDIWSRIDWQESKLHRLLHRMIDLFRHNDPGEDDGGKSYDIERPEWADEFVPSDWFDERFGSEGLTLHGPCFVVYRGNEGRSAMWIRRGEWKRTALPSEKTWICFTRSASADNPYPHVHEFGTFRGALK